MAQACKQYEAKLEDLLGRGEAEGELAMHLERCPACREALQEARLAHPLLRAGLEAAPEPGSAFATRVLASIRAEEARRLEFWRPLEALASRLALTAAAMLLGLSVYLYEFTPRVSREPAATSQSQVAEDFPEPAGQPAGKDEILLSLAETNHGR